jgi:hypothetical protein
VKIIHGRPPNYDAVVAVFPLAFRAETIFAYGDSIYTLSRAKLPPQLIAHEEVHGLRQLEIGVETWWRRYLADPDFRFNEELLAHRAEYQKLCEVAPSRQTRRAGLRQVAQRLASPLYNRMVNVEQAQAALLA